MKKNIYSIMFSLLLSSRLLADVTTYEFTNEAITVVSSTDGLGSFTYSYTAGTNSLYEIRMKDVVIDINPSLVTDAIIPSGWDTQIGSTSIVFLWTNSVPIDALSTTPINFQIQSSVSEPFIISEGIATFSSPLGYSKFNYIQPIPEPSTLSFMVIASGIYFVHRRIRK